MKNKNKSKRDLAEIAIRLYINVDEADQFADLIPELIRHCDKSFLLDLIDRLKDSVEYNLEHYDPDITPEDPDELREFLETI